MTRFAAALLSRSGAEVREVEVRRLVIAGWTGRDAAALEAHIAELQALGVLRPTRTPIFYEIAAAQLTCADAIQVVGAETSGEVECVYLQQPDGVWIGVGSDHTDRRLETTGVTLSKQVCPKPVAPAFWPLDDVADHFDALILRSWATIAGERRLYQEGAVTAMRPPHELAALWTGSGDLPQGSAMFGGTLAVAGGLRFASRFEVELHDPRLNRTLIHAYDIAVLEPQGQPSFAKIGAGKLGTSNLPER